MCNDEDKASCPHSISSESRSRSLPLLHRPADLPKAGSLNLGDSIACEISLGEVSVCLSRPPNTVFFCKALDLVSSMQHV